MDSNRDPSSTPVLLSYQLLVGAVERLKRKRPTEMTEGDWLTLVETTRDRLSQDSFVAEPMDAFETTSAEKVRVVAAPRPSDRLLEEALLPFVRKAVEPLLLPSVHGYRRGHSTFTAAIAAWRGVASGRTEILMLDVASFYDSVDRAKLSMQLAVVLPADLVRLVDALVSAPYLLHGKLVERTRGIPPGRVLSPILANLHLASVDESVRDLEGTYLRYGDDLLFAARDAAVCDEAETRLETALAALDLRISEGKRKRFRFTGEPFIYLGHAVDERGVFERLGGPRLEKLSAGPAAGGSEPGAEDQGGPGPQSNTRCQTLYVTEPGLYLKVRDGLLAVHRGKEVIREVPLHRVDRVLVLAGVAMTSGFLTACISRGVPVLFFVGRGKAYGSLVAGGLPNPLRLQSQYRLSSDSVKRMALGRDIVDAKLRAMLRRLSGVKKAALARERITAIVAKIPEAGDPGVLRGLEGVATRSYYEGFAFRLRAKGFEFERRSRRPPRDPLNSLLSFAYSLVFSEMQTALLAHGLDPHPGLLHDLERNHPALASDLIEPYRVLIADSFVLTLVNNSRVSLADFERHDPGVFLTADGRRKALQEYEAFMKQPSGGPRASGPPRDLIDAAARAMLEVVLGHTDHLVLPLTAGEVVSSLADEEPE